MIPYPGNKIGYCESGIKQPCACSNCSAYVPTYAKVIFSGLQDSCYYDGTTYSYKSVGLADSINGLEIFLFQRADQSCYWYKKETGVFGSIQKYTSSNCSGGYTETDISSIGVLIQKFNSTKIKVDAWINNPDTPPEYPLNQIALTETFFSAGILGVSADSGSCIAKTSASNGYTSNNIIINGSITITEC